MCSLYIETGLDLTYLKYEWNGGGRYLIAEVGGKSFSPWQGQKIISGSHLCVFKFKFKQLELFS